MADRLQELCEDILDNMEDAASCVLEDDFAAPGEGDDMLRTHLEETLERIEAALERLGGGETVDFQQQAASLPEAAERCRSLARDLFDEAGDVRDSEEELRAQLGSLRELIERKPGGFLDLAHAKA